MPSRRTRRIRFERLESRQLLAGQVLVTVMNGDLVITGDTGDNSIEIAVQSPGQFQVSGRSGTEIVTSGDPHATTALVTGITRDVLIDLKDGNDTALLHPDPNTPITNAVVPQLSPRHVSVRVGRGANSVTIENGTIPGSLAIGRDTGTTVAQGNNISLVGLTVQGDVSIAQQQGPLHIGLAKDQILGRLSVQSSGDAARVAMRQVNVGKEADLLLGIDNAANQPDRVAISGSKFGHRLNIHTGGGDDVVRIGQDGAVTAAIDAVFASTADDALDGRVDIANSLYVTTRGGADEVLLANVGVGIAAIVDTGAGDDTIRIQQIAVGNALNINGGDGNNHVAINGISAKNLTVLLGNGNDDISISRASIAKSVNVNGGAGVNHSSVSENHFPRRRWGIFRRTNFSNFRR